VRRLARAWLSDGIELDTHAALTAQRTIPGHPVKPELVAPRLVKRRSMITPEGRAILIHALAHIEFNAINLALDAIWRYAGMPREYYADWLQVADEEALHFSLLSGHLQVQGYAYGDFPAHSSLWRWRQKRSMTSSRASRWCAHDGSTRLDATPQVRAKLAQAKDMAAPRSWISSCTMRSATSRSATAGTTGCAHNAAWNRSPPMPAWQPNTRRR